MRWVLTTLIACVACLVAAPIASPHAGHAPLEIDIGNHAFAPQDAQIYQGDSVVFTWRGPDTNHSATADNGAFDTSATHLPGDTYAVSFSEVGTFKYHCKVHPDMTGTITVNSIPGAPPRQKPSLTKVSASPTSFARKTTLKFNLDGPASVRAQLRNSRKTVKEVDFSGHPGLNTKKLDFGKKLRTGRYTLRVVAIDPSSGLSSNAASVKVRISKARASAAAISAPPITCGRVTIKNTRYVVKSHGPSCTTAINGVKGYITRRTSPRFYKCKSYGGDIPAYCIGSIAKYKKRYFFANKA